MRFSRQYYSYQRPTASNTRGQRAYKSFRQELLLRSMLLNVVKCRVHVISYLGGVKGGAKLLWLCC